MKMLKTNKGFTLIELMIVVAIIGILAAIAIPQFANLIGKSQEGATKGNLGSIRSALSIYYGDTEGWYPVGADLQPLLTSQRYLGAMPVLNLPHTINSAGHGTSIIAVTTGNIATTGVTDVGQWFYDNSGQGTAYWGSIVVGCTHKDIRGSVWSAF